MSDPFWPQTLNEWVWLTLELAAAVLVVAFFIWRIMLKEINGVGKRVAAIETEVPAITARAEKLERSFENAGFHAKVDSERMGKMEEKISRYGGELRNVRAHTADQQAALRERLVAIETRLEVLDDIRDTLEVLRNRSQ